MCKGNTNKNNTIMLVKHYSKMCLYHHGLDISQFFLKDHIKKKLSDIKCAATPMLEILTNIPHKVYMDLNGYDAGVSLSFMQSHK